MISAQLLPHSSSEQSAASAIRRSPGGNIGNSSRNLPLDPPLSATVTIAVICEVIARSDVNVAKRPCPPPSATTRGDDIDYSRPTSLWVAWAEISTVDECSLSWRAISRAMETLRCFPPVQPTARVTNLLPSRK